ncbi:peptidase family M49-domain-containing protein [Aspergillus ambiguus]|uniref:dipeptidyl peptidase III n=1 Tax=Aspergillus ambiguus TaxID=176160 RepID=UPI003CCE06AC
MTKPQIYQLSVGTAFDGLTSQEKRYAHYMAKAAWAGTRIILRQVSPEANGIFDLILALHRLCDGKWESLATHANVNIDELNQFLDYSATFLSNIGNYFGSGDQKIIPDVSQESLNKLASGNPETASLLDNVRESMFRPFPNRLGCPSALTQTTYYLGKDCMEYLKDFSSIAELMEEQGIQPENTRLRRTGSCYDILQASVAEGESGCFLTDTLPGKTIRLVKGDHREELERICQWIKEATNYASNSSQKQMLQQLLESFTSGDLQAYKTAQRIWVNDKAPSVETVIGFVEPYRDPLGVRGEFEGIVGISDSTETKRLSILANMANNLIRRLPWVDGEDGSKGPFEKDLFDAPDFSSVHSLAYCASIIFPGINLPNYNDIRQETGHKNLIFSSRMLAESYRARGLGLVDQSERESFKAHRFHAYYIWVVLHEILGHGTGKLLVESTPGSFNFDPEHPPNNPVTGMPVETWYRPGQTWTGVFEDIATTVDECRAELVGAYLIDEPEILQLFGYNDESDVKADDVVYNMYLQLAVDGLRGLENYDPSTQKWGQAHSRAHYAIFRHLLRDTNGLYTVTCDPTAMSLTVHVDRRMIIKEGKPSLGRMLLRLHIYRCTADNISCRHFYEDLSLIDDDAMIWREIVISKKDPPLVFCHANTFIRNDGIILKEYEPTSRGVIQSWAERQVDEPPE